jgi:hypothetical protein
VLQHLAEGLPVEVQAVQLAEAAEPATYTKIKIIQMNPIDTT